MEKLIEGIIYYTKIGEKSNFQFPLWDTLVILSGIYLKHINFQFPLWDTEQIYDKPTPQAYAFQFPLWDT
jgi:hypothetical protein